MYSNTRLRGQWVNERNFVYDVVTATKKQNFYQRTLLTLMAQEVEIEMIHLDSYLKPNLVSPSKSRKIQI